MVLLGLLHWTVRGHHGVQKAAAATKAFTLGYWSPSADIETSTGCYWSAEPCMVKSGDAQEKKLVKREAFFGGLGVAGDTKLLTCCD